MDTAKKAVAVTLIMEMCKSLMEGFTQTWMQHDSDDDFEELTGLILMSEVKETKSENNRIKNYVEKIVPRYAEKEFQSHFRMSWTAFEALEAVLGPDLQSSPPHKPKIPVRKQLLAILWLLATPDSFRSVGERFNVAKSSLSFIFMRVVQLLCNIADQIITWPTVEEKLDNAAQFFAFGGLQHVVGAVDGAFIEIKAPKEHPENYTCRKCFPAMVLQAIAVPTLKFIDAFAGYPGSVGDRRVFTNSPIYQNITSDKTKFFTEEEYILGDKAYPILTWCVPPYINRGRLTATQINFNQKHAKTRQVVERSFALLFGRWRRLKYLDMNVTKMMPSTILAACVLHNICLNHQNLYKFNEAAIVEGEAFMDAQRARIAAANHGLGDDGHVNVINLVGPENRAVAVRDRLAQRIAEQ